MTTKERKEAVIKAVNTSDKKLYIFEISQMTGISETGVKRILNSLGSKVEYHDVTSLEKNIQTLKQSGLTNQEIASQLGIKKLTVDRKLRRKQSWNVPKYVIVTYEGKVRRGYIESEENSHVKCVCYESSKPIIVICGFNDIEFIKKES